MLVPHGSEEQRWERRTGSPAKAPEHQVRKRRAFLPGQPLGLTGGWIKPSVLGVC